MEGYVYNNSYKNILNPYFNYYLFVNKKNPKTRFVLMNDKTISISNREFQCVKLLAHGKRVKGIVRCLNISHRTVESYLDLLKEKTICQYHEKLIDFYWTYLEPKNIEF